MSPREVDRLTLAEFDTMLRGFAKSRGVSLDDAPSEADYLEALAAFQAAGLA
ncbi:hypothetical protein [Methylosinus sp. Sm6]|uniref:hypothetical protein n=1 Tax=Methylosinus sp. Sm6 TaxID=2866948 RepID=UPI001C99909E|nr:hypothetical protein [Methylosinus sp. Sm6]MBY6242842.1 hypothetical protein [Methylosinus sp. Sm6]